MLQSLRSMGRSWCSIISKLTVCSVIQFCVHPSEWSNTCLFHRSMWQNYNWIYINTEILVNQSSFLLDFTNLCCLHLQRGNPLLKSIFNVPWEYEEIIPDYVMGRTTCALFLSLRYHNLNPDYINERLKQLGKQYELRVLLVQVCLATQRFYSLF